MQVLVGIDVIAISRIRSLLESYPDKFPDYAFTKSEQKYCNQQAHPAQHYAVRWSVKEAFIKSIAQPGANPDLPSIEVTNELPLKLSLSGDALNLLEQITPEKKSYEDVEISVSMSHERNADIALAIVVIML